MGQGKGHKSSKVRGHMLERFLGTQVRICTGREAKAPGLASAPKDKKNWHRTQRLSLLPKLFFGWQLADVFMQH